MSTHNQSRNHTTHAVVNICSIRSPLPIVHKLAHYGMRLDSAIGIHLGHVQVINKVDKPPLGAARSIATPRLLLERPVEHLLEYLGCGVEVEVCRLHSGQ